MDDTISSMSQQSQYMRERFPPQQSRQASPVSMKEARERLISILMAKNNNDNEDQGIHIVLICLGSDSILRTMTITKLKRFN